MIHISLPIIYSELEFMNQIYSHQTSGAQDNPDFKITNLNIDSFHGSIPFAIWNGDINLNIRNTSFFLNDDIYNLFRAIKTPIRFNCSNLYIDENILNDRYQHLILNYGNEIGNFIEVSDLGVFNYLKEKYPYYDFIFSKNANLINSFTPDILNVIIEQDIFYLIELPYELKFNNDFLDKLKYKNKVEIPIGNRCQNKCANLDICGPQEQTYIINYSEKTIYYNCQKMNDYKNNNELIEEINYFKNLGFSNFKVDTPPLYKIDEFKTYLTNNLLQV